MGLSWASIIRPSACAIPRSAGPSINPSVLPSLPQTFNHGKEQANLDGVPSPQVEVTALSLAASTPHLELLCYRSGIHLPRRMLSSNDVAATRIALATDGLRNNVEPAQRIIVDPDGHHLHSYRDCAALRYLRRTPLTTIVPALLALICGAAFDDASRQQYLTRQITQ